MWKTFEVDREYIENKFHRTDEPFNAFNSRYYHGYEYDPATGLSDEEMKNGLEALYPTIKDLPHPIAKARAVEYVLDHTRIDVNRQDYFIGIYSWGRDINTVTISKWRDEIFSQKLPDTGASIKKHGQAGTLIVYPDYDHSIPDWQAVFSLGFRGIADRAETYRKTQASLTPEQEVFFESIRIEYAAILRLLDRLYKYALTQKHDKAKKIAACLAHLRDGAPQNTYEVLQIIYIYFMICESIECIQVRSLGSGLDAALYPYFKKDLESGEYTKDELCEYIAYFLMQFSAIGFYWGHPFYLGGTGEDGESLINEATWAILDVYEQINIYNPKIQIKVNRNTPRELVHFVMNMIRKGRSSFVFLCEPAIIKSMMSLGVTYTEARTCDISGCYELKVRGGEVSTLSIWMNMLKPICLVLNNGVDTLTGETIGLKTGEIENFQTFDDFYQAYMRQLEFILDSGMELADKFEKYLGEINPTPMYSATIEHSLRVMKDACAFGSKYNNTGVLHSGFASAVDSLMAVKFLVYDNKTTTLAELKQALQNDWNGYEALRLQAKKCLHKFGNNDSTADIYAVAMSKWLCFKENMRPNTRGGVYKAAMHSALKFLEFGKITEATPDGRKRGDEISKNISPVMGMDKRGVTALINSVIKLDPSLYTEDFCLDVMLHSSATEGEDGLAAMSSILDTYMDNDGLAIQFNVFNTDILHDAQKHPERYENLQVRVCGWNVCWRNMSREEQDAYILRSENIQ